MTVRVTHTKTLVSPDSGVEDKIYGSDWVAPDSHTVTGFNLIPGQDGQDGQDGDSGPPGPAGAPGSSGAPGIAGPAVFLVAEDGTDGEPGPPGVAGSAGATGASGGGITKIAGATGAAGADATWEVLTAASGNITGTAFVTVMEMTGVGLGRYHFKCELIYQTTAITTGINVTATHTGTVTTWIMRASVPTTGAAAATKAAVSAAQGAAGGLWETEVELTKGAGIGTLSNFTISVDAANTNQIVVIEGSFVVSVTGSLQIRLSAELAALVCTAREGSFLELDKLS